MNQTYQTLTVDVHDVRQLFDVTAIGFDGDTDETDDRVLWVRARSLEHLQQALEGVPYQSITDLPDDLKVNESDIDFDLRVPDDGAKLAETLRNFAAHL
jgi:hypothetical protein